MLAFGSSNKKMKAGIIDPYLDTLGGGEKYCLTVVEFLLSLNWQVDFFWAGKDLKQKIKERMGINLERVNFVPPSNNLLEKLLSQPKYDLLFHLSDGSLPFMFGKRNILHLQVPFKKVNGDSSLNKLKLKKIDQIICNSKFTKKFIDQEFGVESVVVYPPVDVERFKKGKKENLIIAVGRFSQLLQAKRQDVLVNSFINLFKNGLRGWKLFLVGGSEIGGENFVKDLRKAASGYPIEILENISLNDLANLYSKAKIFWAANGFDVDEIKNPEKVEHFGISVVEAMSAGVVPLLVEKGGFREIIEDEKSGFFWETTEDLERITLRLKDDDLFHIGEEAIKRSRLFSKEKFYERIKKIII